MGRIITDSDNYKNIANEIRAINNTTDELAPEDMAASIKAIGEKYEPIANVTSKGTQTTPVYFDESGVAQPITSYEGNSATTDKLKTPIDVTIGSTTKSLDGSANLSFSLKEMGVQTASIEDGVLTISIK